MMKLHSRNAARQGTIALYVMVLLIPILMTMAFAVDAGALISHRRQTQAVADATAHAAACVLAKNYATDAGLDPQGKARTAALSIASENKFENDGITSVVEINIPPTIGTSAGKHGYVEAIVTFKQPRHFSAIFKTDPADQFIPVVARSIVRLVLESTPSVLITDPTSNASLSLTGGARLTTYGSIRVNSNSIRAVESSNGAYLETDKGSPGLPTNAKGVRIVGGYQIPNWATYNVFFKDKPHTSQATADDPYKLISPPSTTGLTARGAPNPPYGSATLNPGIYEGGLTLGGGMTITMNPGIYYMKGGSFTVANGVNLTGSGVMIYMDNTGGSGIRSLNFQGGTTVKLTPPTSGTYKGITYFQDRFNTSSLSNIANGSTVNMTGAIYAPSAPLAIAGGASGAKYGDQLIVKTLALSNNVNVNIGSSSGAATVKSLSFAE